MRTHFCGELNAGHIDESVQCCGWVHRRRDHGGVIFLDVRDRTGLVQVVFDPDDAPSFAIADRVRSEYVLQIEGRVRARPDGHENPDLASGAIEVLGRSVEVLNSSATPPFQLDEYSSAGEDIRLRYRYLDLRRPEMQQRLITRSKVTASVRRYLEGAGYLDIETPMLTRTTPEGAREYIVPSRIHQGNFFALPQSPQLFKQLLMMSGFDRYYQIVRCFRDEDLRADRQPEFTQIDIEASFVDQKAIMTMAEGLISTVFREVQGIELPAAPVLTWAEAMAAYGTDKPDLRNPMKFVDVADLMAKVEFKVFRGPAEHRRGRVVVLRAPGGGRLSRREIDAYTELVGEHGAGGLAWIKVNDVAAGVAGLQSPILKFLPEEVVATVLERCGAEDGDILFFGADKATVVNDALGVLRNRLGTDLGLLEDGFRPCWVVDWPMFELSGGALTAMHHPFTQPACTVEELRAKPSRANALAYDYVLNGHELGGGSLRIHEEAMQRAVFDALKMGESADAKFGFLLDALGFGCPPHGGIAFGLDRLCMLISGVDAIRDVIAFPKTQSSACLLTAAPGEVDGQQLRELGLSIQGSGQPGAASGNATGGGSTGGSDGRT